MNLIPWRRKRETGDEREQSETSLAHLRQDMDSLFDRFFRDPWGWITDKTAEDGLSSLQFSFCCIGLHKYSSFT